MNGIFVVGDGDALLVENPSDGGEVARFRGLSSDQFGGPNARSIRCRLERRATGWANLSPACANTLYVFGEDAEEALAVARHVHSGAVHVNGALSSTYVPFGGVKASGLGHERGSEGMRMFQRLRIFSVTQ